MILWLDAHISPHLAPWLERTFDLEARSLRYLGLQFAEDPDIFFQARDAEAVLITKDQDFLDLLELHGPPPKVIWLNCGNTSNMYLRTLLTEKLQAALDVLDHGESMVEISDRSPRG